MITNRLTLAASLFVALLSSAACAQPVVIQPSEDELLTALASKTPAVAATAADTLGQRKFDSERTIRALLRALDVENEDEPRPAEQAQKALGRIGKPAAPYLAAFLREKNSERSRVRVLRALSKIGHDGIVALPAVTEALSDQARDVRILAVHAIIALQPAADELDRPLILRLRDESPDVRAAAIKGLAQQKQAAAAAVPGLQRLLDDKESFYVGISSHFFISRPVRLEAARALAEIRVGAKDAVPKLNQMMRSDEEHLVRAACAFALCRISDDPGPGLVVLTRSLANRDEGTALPELAADLLAELGPAATSSLPQLQAALRHPSEGVRSSVVKAVVAVAPDRAAASILPLAADEDVFVRLAVIESLAKVPEQSDAIIDAYIRALADADRLFGEEIKRGAIEGLGKAGPKAARAKEKLKLLEKDEDASYLREAIAKTLTQIEGKPAAGERR